MSKRHKKRDREAGLSRREFLTAGAAAAGGLAFGGGRAGSPKVPSVGPRKAPVTLNVNGKEHTLEIEPRVTLLRALRNHLDITGPKQVCDRGACGGCNVLVDGLLVNSCMMLAMDAVGRKIVTPEGLARNGKLHPVQEAFCARDALQCGFCTPGMVMAGAWILSRHPDPSPELIKRELSGNLCRCGAYGRICEAVKMAARKK
ncbi:MAG: (2Fe-2S)-binding protein [Planctomycetes bacterium]|nr:(2Fe-2S)-binding protein [Planctomycetota bacterium]